jgi:hypothetical protein
MKLSIDKKFAIETHKLVQKMDKVGGEALKEARDIVRVITDKVQSEAIARAPVDESMLEQSIDKKMEGWGKVGDITGYVFIPSNAPAASYAMYMHEMKYNLGERSQQKQAGSKVAVGRKYLQRALDENARALSLYIIKRLREFFK